MRGWERELYNRWMDKSYLVHLSIGNFLIKGHVGVGR